MKLSVESCLENHFQADSAVYMQKIFSTWYMFEANMGKLYGVFVFAIYLFLCQEVSYAYF